MNDALILIGILAAWVIAIYLLPDYYNYERDHPKLIKKVKNRMQSIKHGKSGTYDPTTDEHRKMSGEVESYFD
jgi:hypothetical protein